MRARLLVADGDHVKVGQQLIAGAVNPHEVLRILGSREVQLHLVHEVQEVYRSQGVSIHDKHIEIIIRQMLKRVNVLESGDTELLPGELVERPKFEEVNRAVVEAGGTSASGRPELMGITKASLATESWLSAASFQETTRVLTDAAIHARSDSLVGLKENVIIGKLIPAGTGMQRYRCAAGRADRGGAVVGVPGRGRLRQPGRLPVRAARRVRRGDPARGVRLRRLQQVDAVSPRGAPARPGRPRHPPRAPRPWLLGAAGPPVSDQRRRTEQLTRAGVRPRRCRVVPGCGGIKGAWRSSGQIELVTQRARVSRSL